jgi:DinB superfamily
MSQINPLPETERIADQLLRATSGSAWHGLDITALLSDVDAAAAASRPVPMAHTIWELVLHVTAWADVARRRLAAQPADLSPEDDWPAPVEQTDAAWRRDINAMREAHKRLRTAILALDPARLDEQTIGKPDSLYVLLHGTVQHAAYHGGQMALLKRALHS